MMKGDLAVHILIFQAAQHYHILVGHHSYLAFFFLHTVMMRASFRLLTAVSIVITLFLINDNLNYIQDLQDRIHNSRLLDSGKPEEGKPHGTSSNDGAVETVSSGLKADMSRILFVSITTTSTTTTTTTTKDTVGRTSTPEPISPDQIIVLGRTSGENTSWVEQLDRWVLCYISIVFSFSC